MRTCAVLELGPARDGAHAVRGLVGAHAPAHALAADAARVPPGLALAAVAAVGLVERLRPFQHLVLNRLRLIAPALRVLGGHEVAPRVDGVAHPEAVEGAPGGVCTRRSGLSRQAGGAGGRP